MSSSLAEDVSIRELGASDAFAFQEVRLQALQETPTAFGTSHDEERDRPAEDVRALIAGSEESAFFGAFHQTSLVGIVGVGREQRAKKRHTAFVRSMYVAPGYRGLGIGKQLLNVALQRARGWTGVEQVTLAVTAGNDAAVGLYRALGFEEIGRMPRALQIGGAYFDELAMICLIDQPALGAEDV
jgi:ribosomal protein S18 acetylase RimI-like enzyme